MMTIFGKLDDMKYVYGDQGCISLATSNPIQVLANADSFEYFLESGANCP